jgi:glycosyltransferase involved in cell wall biosynthesis
MKTTIVIPALNPDIRLIQLVEALVGKGFDHIVLVDDGSDAYHQGIFEQLMAKNHCELIRHPENLGKGMALKHGFQRAIKAYPDDLGCITVDADGQHAVADIERIAAALATDHNAMILGTRHFDASDVPMKSKLGNQLTVNIFNKLTRRVITDTQTGLRGIPMGLLPRMIGIQGQRYEYEMNMLLEAVKCQIPFVEVPIETIYYDDNRGSHFNVFSDSVRIYRQIFVFALSGCCSACIDIGLFFLLSHTFLAQQLFWANVLARIVSGGFNFSVNQRLVFKRDGSVKSAGIK